MTAITNITNTTNTQLQQLANEFINMTFWGPMLREFRANQQPTIFGEGPGSGTFVHQLDMEIIRRMSQRGSSPLADALLKELGAHAAPPQPHPQPPTSTPTATQTPNAGHRAAYLKNMTNPNGLLRGNSNE